MPTGAISMPSTKGTRQPQLCMASGVSEKVSAPTTTAPSITPRPWLANCQLAM